MISFPIKYFWIIGLVTIIIYLLKFFLGLTRTYSFFEMIKGQTESETNKLSDDFKYLEIWTIYLNYVKNIFMYLLYFGLIIKIKKGTKS